MSESIPPPVLALVRDLLFASRISGAAKEASRDLKIVRDPARLAAENGQLLIVDLNLEGAIDAAALWQRRTGGKTVGFVFHVDGPTIAQARGAGIQQIVTRGQFAQALPAILSGS
jgi:hypothetical protein